MLKGGFYTHKIQKLIYMDLFTKLFHEDFCPEIASGVIK